MKMVWIAILVFVGLPVLSFLIMKFGTAGYVRGKQVMKKNKIK